MREALSVAASWYSDRVGENPLLANAIVGGSIAGLGDVLVQQFIQKDQPYDVKRTARMAFIRAMLCVPFLLWWYSQLMSMYPGKREATILKRIVTDQAFGTPIMIALVFLGNALLTGESPADIAKSFKTKFLTTWLKGAQFWPLCHYLGTYRLELMYQPLFAHVASMYWNGVLSIAANKSKQE